MTTPGSGGTEPGRDTILLAGLEARVLGQVQARLDDIANHYGAYLATVIRDSDHLTGVELLSRPDLHNTLMTVVDGAHSRTETVVRAGYRAAHAAGRTFTEDDLNTEPSTPESDSDDTGILPLIIAGLAVAFAAAAADIAETVRTAFDGVSTATATGVTAVTAAAVTAARILATHAAVDRAVRRLGVRTRSAAVVAVHRGFTDGQLAAVTAYTDIHTGVAMLKEWATGAADPCPTCRALNGTTIPVNDEFDREAGASPTWRPPKVFDNLLGPPRHPHCRCRLRMRPSGSGAAVARTTSATPGIDPAHLTAAGIRDMDRARFTALVAFFTTAARKLTSLIRRPPTGG